MRFADVDMLRHVNNVNQQHYYDIGKADYFTQVIHSDAPWPQDGFITVETDNTYISQIRYKENIVVRTRAERIGNKSLTLFQWIVNLETDEIKSESRSVMVAFNFARQESIAVTAQWRGMIEAHEGK